MLNYYPITPMAKPRMTRADGFTMSKLRAGKRLNEREQKRAPLLSAWLAYSDEVRLNNVQIPEGGSHIIFVIPFPRSWSMTRRDELRGRPHRGKADKAKKNDKDNLEKGLLDVVFGDDSAVWDSRVSKVWHDNGGIFVAPEGCGFTFSLPFDASGWSVLARRPPVR